MSREDDIFDLVKRLAELAQQTDDLELGAVALLLNMAALETLKQPAANECAC
jgi:hypothetical protein